MLHVELSASPCFFVPFRPLQHLYTIDDQISALHCAKAHLQPDGLLTFNIFYPNFRMLDEVMETEVLDAEWVTQPISSG